MIYEYRACVIDVYDADTVRADIDLGLSTWRHGEPLRLYGINAPEMRGPERLAGILARDALRARVLGKELTIRTIKDEREKYGRYLAVLLDADGNVNEWLVEQGHAVAYLP
jgi:micrococcal nuclease